MTQTAFVESLIDRFDIEFETETPASIEYGLGPKRIDKNESDWSYKQLSVVCCGSRGRHDRVLPVLSRKWPAINTIRLGDIDNSS